MIEKKGGYREITISASVLGVILGVLMTMSFVYAGLKLGFTIGGSSVAAILGFVFLKGILRKGTIIENNINQTIASGINIASGGIIFTLPALFLMGIDFDPWKMIIAATAGSFLGIAVIIPLRKQMIEIDRLRFPTGTAVAAILKSPGAGARRAVLLISGFVLSLATVIFIKAGLLPGEIPLGRWLGLPGYTQTAVALSLMNIGAGMLAGRGGLPFALGGILSYWIIAPASVEAGWMPHGLDASDMAGYLYSTMLRPLGIGLLLGGALGGVIAAFPSIKGALKSLKIAAQSGTGKRGAYKDEIDPRLLILCLGAALLVFFSLSYLDGTISFLKSIDIALTAVMWIGISGLIVAQCTGATDISPISGLSLIAITIILAITGGNVISSVLIGVAACVATSQCADMMQDLKTGHLVGAIPAKQQGVQFSVAWLGPIAAIATIYLLWNTGTGAPGFGPESTACATGLPDCISAPQAGALKAMIQGVLRGDVPLEKYFAGGIIGGVLAVLPAGGLGVLVGLAMYLPFPITLGFGLGCIITMILEKAGPTGFMEDKIVPFAAGLIIGEAITELGYSLYMMFH